MINIDDRILSEVDENQLFLLCAIAKHMGSNAKAWPSNKTLCETTKWSPNKLQRVKKSAMEAGLLGAESRFQKSAQTSNMYQIKTRRIAVMVNLADIEPHPQNGVSPHPQNGGTEVLTNEVLKNEVLTNKQTKADKPQPSPQNDFSNDEIQGESNLNENPKKEKNFTGRGAKISDGAQVSEVVNFLNETVKPACNFRESSKATAAHIRQRVAEGFSVSDICIVIEHKNSQWRNDPKMSEYLRPATLFGTGKFEAYLVAARTWEKSGKRSASSQSANQNQNRSITTDFGADKDKFQQPQIF